MTLISIAGEYLLLFIVLIITCRIFVTPFSTFMDPLCVHTIVSDINVSSICIAGSPRICRRRPYFTYAYIHVLTQCTHASRRRRRPVYGNNRIFIFENARGAIQRKRELILTLLRQSEVSSVYFRAQGLDIAWRVGAALMQACAPIRGF